MQLFNFRLHPGDDVKLSLEKICRDHKLQAAAVIAAVGSLSEASLRFADAQASAKLPGPWEIVSLSGTMSVEGLHLHISIADSQGQARGGHLMPGCLIHTTLELVILEQPNIRFTREPDPQTGYKELLVKS